MFELRFHIGAQMAAFALARSFQLLERTNDCLNQRLSLSSAVNFKLAHVIKLGDIRQQRHADLSCQPLFFFQPFHAGHVLCHQRLVHVQSARLSLGRVAMNKQIDPASGNPLANELANLLLERKKFSRHAQLHIQVAMVEAANLHGQPSAPNVLRSLAVSGHALHDLSSMVRLSLSMATATVPTSSPTNPAAKFASTAASS